jgi:hypothetical protein
VAYAAAAGLVIEVTATVALESKKPAEQARTGIFDIWLPVLDACRTLCIAPTPEARAVFQAVRDSRPEHASV